MHVHDVHDGVHAHSCHPKFRTFRYYEAQIPNTRLLQHSLGTLLWLPLSTRRVRGRTDPDPHPCNSLDFANCDLPRATSTNRSPVGASPCSTVLVHMPHGTPTRTYSDNGTASHPLLHGTDRVSHRCNYSGVSLSAHHQERKSQFQNAPQNEGGESEQDPRHLCQAQPTQQIAVHLRSVTFDQNDKKTLRALEKNF